MRLMTTADEIRKREAAQRRVRLAELLRLHFDGHQVEFIKKTGINQGELSALLKDKSFGGVKARGIEGKAELIRGSLDEPIGSPFYVHESYQKNLVIDPSINRQNDGMIDTLNEPPGPSMNKSQPSLMSRKPDAAKVRRVYAVGRAQGGLPERIWTDGDYPVGATDEYTEIATSDPHAFLVPVVGTSMVPRFNPGEFAFVSPGLEPHHGDDVLVRLLDGSTLIKKLISTRGSVVELHSYNTLEQGPLFFKSAEISWMYYIGYPVPSRMMKQMT